MMLKICLLLLTITVASFADDAAVEIFKNEFINPVIDHLKQDVLADDKFEAFKSYLTNKKEYFERLVNDLPVDNDSKRLLTSDGFKQALKGSIGLVDEVLPYFQEGDANNNEEPIKNYFTKLADFTQGFLEQGLETLEGSDYEKENKVIQNLFGNQRMVAIEIPGDIASEGVSFALNRFLSHSLNDHETVATELGGGVVNQPVEEQAVDIFKKKLTTPMIENLKQAVVADDKFEALKSFLQRNKEAFQDLIELLPINNEVRRLLSSGALKQALEGYTGLINDLLSNLIEGDADTNQEQLKNYFIQLPAFIQGFSTQIPGAFDSSSFEKENTAIQNFFGHQQTAASQVSEDISSNGIPNALDAFLSHSLHDYELLEKEVCQTSSSTESQPEVVPPQESQNEPTMVDLSPEDKEAAKIFQEKFLETETTNLEENTQNENKLDAFKTYLNQKITNLNAVVNAEEFQLNKPDRILGSSQLKNALDRVVGFLQSILANFGDNNTEEENFGIASTLFTDIKDVYETTISVLKNTELFLESEGRFRSENGAFITYLRGESDVNVIALKVLNENDLTTALQTYLEESLKNIKSFKNEFEVAQDRIFSM